MKLRINILTIFLATLFQFAPVILIAQAEKKAGLEKAVENARARVALFEKKISEADSLINAGNQMIKESKAEARRIDADSKMIEKEYAAKRKSLVKASTSKNKEEATKARAELKALDTRYRNDNRALEVRLKEAAKKQNSGIASIEKGKVARKNAQDGLKTATEALKAAQAKLDAASAPAEDKNSKGKK